jgi:dTDP-4-dehydrorhamnose 3,5-epimerase
MNPVRLIKPRRFGDARGWFTEFYNQRAFAALGLDDLYLQDNHSLSQQKGVLRGLHFQTPPHGQAKLVRCIRGAVFDVAVDVRRGSPTYGRWVGTTLSAENGHQLYIPVGFAHGFITLEDGCEVTYKVTAHYAPDHDGGIIWNDPDITVDWPDLPASGALLSGKDQMLGRLKDFDSPFAYDGRPLLPLDQA